MHRNKNLIDDGFRADLVTNATFEGTLEIPSIKRNDEIIIPKDTIPFSLMNQTKDYSEFVVFYEHDIKFADLLVATDEYIDQLSDFKGVVSPDCSLYRDMPLTPKSQIHI